MAWCATAWRRLKGVGQAAMEAMVAERQANGPFKDLRDFAVRAAPFFE